MSATALVIAPFMNRRQHVGTLRIRRFVRWLAAGGYRTTLVSAGERNGLLEHPWGREVVVADPLGLHSGHGPAAAPLLRREYSPLVEFASRMVFSPDPAIAWGRKVIGTPEVLSAAAAADVIISSSPPESGHVVAMQLARGTRARLVVDMRDGWLDEPLKIALAQSPLQRWREGRLERGVLQAADHVFVTSAVWEGMLTSRYPEHSRKLSVLPNCYPLDSRRRDDLLPREDRRLVLLHAGQFRGSKYNNRPDLLLGPVVAAVQMARLPVRLICHGQFTRQDLADLEHYRPQLEAGGGSLELHPPLAYEAVLEAVARADGLLLLSATMASLPAKLFEYIPSRRPILAVTPEGSAVWQLARQLPQMHAFSPWGGDRQTVENFLEECRAGDYDRSMVPDEFTDAVVMQRFLSALRPTAMT